MELKWMEVTDVLGGNTDNFKNCIYLWRNKTNGHMYVGKAKDFKKRTREHNYSAYNENDKAYNYHVHNAIRRHGLGNFEICVLEEDLLEEYLNEREIYWIAYYNTFKNKKHYNMTEGGDGVGSGENNPSSTKVICITTGNVYESIMEAERQTKVANQNISACCRSMKCYKRAGTIDGKPAIWMFLEDFDKLTEEEIEEIKNQKTGIECVTKQIICITTGNIYESISEAGRQTGINYSNISSCCRGKRKSAGKHPITGKKLVWMFYDKYLEQNK